MTAIGEVTLVVIAKDPVPGRVKTRLCPPCSPQQAADIARAALLDTLDAVGAARAGRRVLAFDGPRPDWLPATFDVVAQRGNGLDERLAAVFAASSNAPLALSVMAVELLGVGVLPHVFVVCVVAFSLSGRRTIYSAQRWPKERE